MAVVVAQSASPALAVLVVEQVVASLRSAPRSLPQAPAEPRSSLALLVALPSLALTPPISVVVLVEVVAQPQAQRA